ncbi:hypothetical protein PpBr36_03968 [Pyricularia pennisetigena]|uniref:hypothetical protein n=1 Tax=Pyricularia pennisetigena TaxID=1578925 RepID=UPI001150BB5D|nr:hypothetical protein PpBr36_03968 [Pyricularia pennisetigena]TLS26111.1 hypothetical protein PpBr36_03968 [Pyricularia pennisetigena]
MGNWRSLGGRLRLNSAGRVELHVPNHFTTDRPSVHFTQERHDLSVLNHELRHTLPRNSNIPFVVDIRETFGRILAGPDAPRSFDDYINTDRPALSVHVIIFTDCTFVTIVYSHSIADGMGRRALMDNWCRVLRGDKASVMPLADLSDDVLMRVAEADKSRPNERYIWEDKLLTGFSLWRFMARIAFESVFGPRKHLQSVFLPAALVESLRAEARSDGTCSPNLTDGDILAAWLLRLSLAHTPTSSRRPLSIIMVVDTRGRLPSSYLDPKLARISNQWVSAWIPVQLREFVDGSLGRAASLVHETLRPQLSEAQISKLVRFAIERNGTTAFFADTNAVMLPVSNIAKARFQDIIDFGPAVVAPGLDSTLSGTPSGKPVWTTNVISGTHTSGNLCHIQFKDHAGNYWVTLQAPGKTWEKINELTQTLNKLT